MQQSDNRYCFLIKLTPRTGKKRFNRVQFIDYHLGKLIEIFISDSIMHMKGFSIFMLSDERCFRIQQLWIWEFMKLLYYICTVNTEQLVKLLNNNFVIFSTQIRILFELAFCFGTSGFHFFFVHFEYDQFKTWFLISTL